jgi:sarcosine oxidase
VIVIGLGAMGSSTLFHLARRGVRALGLERFGIPHEQGSYHGLTRIIRMAYHEHPSYVALLRRAYPLWRELEAETGERLLNVTGSLDGGARDSPFVTGSLASCREHGLAHELLSRDEIARRFPAFRLPEDFAGVLQPDGGYLLAERSVVAFVDAARRRGAVARTGEIVTGWRRDGDGVAVETDAATYRAGALIVTAGAWTAKLVPALASVVRPERQVVGWFRPRRPELFEVERFPVFDILFAEGNFYGLPATGQPGFKIGRHGHLHEPADPDAVDREVHARDEAVLRGALARYFPEGDGDAVKLTTCLFTNSPDEHFVIDTVSESPRTVIGAGFSGHGFKFAPVMGEILADLAIEGRTRHSIERFRRARFAQALPPPAH